MMMRKELKEKIKNSISKDMTYNDLCLINNYEFYFDVLFIKDLLKKFEAEKILDAEKFDLIITNTCDFLKDSDSYFEAFKEEFIYSIMEGYMDLLYIGNNVLFMEKKHHNLKSALVIFPLCKKSEEIIPKIKLLFTI